MYYTTYETTNNINNKYYIGVHKDINLDYRYMGSGKAIKNSIKKYGIENFSKLVTGVWRTEQISYLMESWIVDLEEVKNTQSYNLKPGGMGGSNKGLNLGIPKSPQTKLKMSIAAKGVPKSEAHKKSCQLAALNRDPMTQDTKDKISLSNKGKKSYIRTDEIRNKNKISATGKIASKESREKMSIAAKHKKPMTQETKNKISSSNKGKTYSEKTIKNMSKGALNRPMMTQETKDNISKGLNKQGGKSGGRKINIFDDSGILQFETVGNFKHICSIYSLPELPLRKSFRNNGEGLYTIEGSSPSNKNKKYIGWYAILV